MTKIVLKKLLIQIIVVVSTILLLIYIPTSLFGPKNIKYTKAEGIGDKGYVFALGNNSFSGTLVTDNYGNMLLEKPYKTPKIFNLGNTSILLIEGNPSNNENVSEVYTFEKESKLNGNKVSLKEQKELLNNIFINVNINDIFKTNYSISDNNKETNIPLCILKERKPNKIDCFSINTVDFSYKKINTDEINQKMNKYISNRYLVSSEEYDQTVEDTFVSLIVHYINDDKNPIGPTDPVFKFKVTSSSVVITQDNSAKNEVDNTEIDQEIISQPYFSYFNYADTIPFSSVDLNMDYKNIKDFDYSLGDKQLSRTIDVNNPVIGEQYLEKNGKKLLSWFSIYNQNNISAGLIDNCIYLKINQDIFILNTKENKTYKINTSLETDSNIRILSIHAF